MNIKDIKCTSLELSKQLKKAGYKQEGEVWWVSVRKGEPELYYREQLGMLETNSPHAYKRICVAPTVAELGERLPKIVEDNIDGRPIQFEINIIRPIDCRAPQWDIFYISPFEGKDILVEIGDDTLANAMAKMWLYLNKEGLL